MPQSKQIHFPDGQTGMVIYPDGKLLKTTTFQPDEHHVVVHYHPPHQSRPDIAQASPSDPYLFVVPSAVIPGLMG